MKEYSRKLLDKALDTIEAAEMLVDNGKSDIAANMINQAREFLEATQAYLEKQDQ